MNVILSLTSLVLTSFQGSITVGYIPPSYTTYFPIDESVISFRNVGTRLAARYSGSQIAEFSDFTPDNGHYPLISSWNAIRLLADPTDMMMTVTAGLAGRLDIISQIQYGRADFWWAIAQANDHTNPFEQPQSGDRIRVPSLARILKILGQVGSGTEISRYNP